MKTISTFKKTSLGTPALSLALTVGFAGATYAGQIDALNLNMETIGAKQRAAEGRPVSAYPAAIQKNTISGGSDTDYDNPFAEGWGETGWQGGD